MACIGGREIIALTHVAPGSPQPNARHRGLPTRSVYPPPPAVSRTKGRRETSRTAMRSKELDPRHPSRHFLHAILTVVAYNAVHFVISHLSIINFKNEIRSEGRLADNAVWQSQLRAVERWARVLCECVQVCVCVSCDDAVIYALISIQGCIQPQRLA